MPTYSLTMVHLLRLIALVLTCIFECQSGYAAVAATEFSIEKIPSWVTAIGLDVNAVLPQEKQSGGVAYLLADRQTFINGETKQSFNHFAFKIQNESGLDYSSNIEIRFDPSYQTLHIHAVNIRRGDSVIPKLKASAIKVLQREKSLEQLIFNGSKTANLFLEDVRVGDVVEFAFTLRGSNPIFKGKHYSQFDLQWGIPIQHVYARLLTDSERKPAIKLVNAEYAAERKKVKDLQEYVWSLKDVAGLRSLDDAPGWFDPLPKVQWSDFADWASVVQWGVPLYLPPLRLSAELATEAERIRAKYASAEDRTAEALRYVQKNVRYLGVEVGPGSHAPTHPDTVLARRFGDCKDKALLAVTLLQSLGVRANTALVNTKEKRGILDWQPSPGVFDHVIVQVKIGEETYWLDPTLQPQMGRIQDFSQANYGYALVLESGQSALTEMKLVPAMTYFRKVLSVFDSSAGWEKAVPLTVTTVLEGMSAERMREAIAKESRQDMQKRLVNYFARHYPSIAIANPYEVIDNSGSNQLTLIEHYVVPNFWRVSSVEKAESYAASPDINDYLRAPQNTVRAEPLALFYPADIRQTTHVLLPDSWKYQPGSWSVKDDAFEFETNVRFVPGRLTIVDSYRALMDSVPAQRMPTYLENLRKARKLLGYSFSRSTKDSNN